MNDEKVGTCFEATVEDLASDGRGIVVHPGGRRFFVAGVAYGEKIVARITRLKGRVGFADCVEVLSSSAARVSPECPHHGAEAGQCGGCPWQFIDYEEQLYRKYTRVQREFRRLGFDQAIAPIIPSPKIYGYRNRAQLKSNGTVVGFVSSASNSIAPIKDCLILSDKNRSTLADMLATLPNSGWTPSKKAQQKKQWTSLDIDESVDITTLKMNQRLPFRQANDAQNAVIKDWLREKLSVLDKEKSVIELFCGSGNLTEIIAAQGFKNIVAVEGVSEALMVLAQKDLRNVETKKADLFLEENLAKLFSKKSTAEILVLDPPRDGLKSKAAIVDRKNNIKDVYYISCNLATLIRDVAEFMLHKFRIVEVQALDQFPHTPHIELMLHLRRK